MEAEEKLDREALLKQLEHWGWTILSSPKFFKFVYWDWKSLEKYKDKVDWTEISKNEDIPWDALMLEHFKNYIDWKQLSNNNNRKLFTHANLKAFADYWDWSALSENWKINWTFSLLNRYADRWDWKKIVDNDSLEAMFSIDFVVKYRRYLPPLTELKETCLGRALQEEMEKILLGHIGKVPGEDFYRVVQDRLAASRDKDE